MEVELIGFWRSASSPSLRAAHGSPERRRAGGARLLGEPSPTLRALRIEPASAVMVLWCVMVADGLEPSGGVALGSGAAPASSPFTFDRVRARL